MAKFAIVPLLVTIPSPSISYKRLLKLACQLEAKVLPSQCSRSLLLPCTMHSANISATIFAHISFCNSFSSAMLQVLLLDEEFSVQGRRTHIGYNLCMYFYFV